VEREEGKQWLNNAKQGLVPALASMLARNGSLLPYAGPGLGHTALHWAAAKGYPGACMWLLKAGADADARNASEATPLHAAAANDQADTALVLLLMGRASKTLRDEDGATAADLALRKKASELEAVFQLAQEMMELRAMPVDQWQDQQVQCHTCATLVSHSCHTCATLVPHLCHTCATLVSHLCHTWMVALQAV
jgi:hypothetical protein